MKEWYISKVVPVSVVAARLCQKKKILIMVSTTSSSNAKIVDGTGKVIMDILNNYLLTKGGQSMDDLVSKLNKKVDSLYEMLVKYKDLNNRTNQKYEWRARAIECQIDALEQLKEDRNSNWLECYIEDCNESNIKRL